MGERVCECGRPALHRVHGGAVQADADHDLCRQCWEARRDAARPKGNRRRESDPDVVRFPRHKPLVERSPW